MAAVLINRQINNYPVAVCVRSNCDAYHIRSLLNYLHTRVEIFRIPVSFSHAYLFYALMIWHPTLLNWHNLRIHKTLSLVFWRLPQISTQHVYHNRPHKRIHRKTLKTTKSKPTFDILTLVRNDETTPPPLNFTQARGAAGQGFHGDGEEGKGQGAC